MICLLVGWAASARAERRPVAVIDLVSDSSTRALVDELRAELDTHPELRTLPSATDAAALTEPLDDPDAARLASARARKTQADAALGQFDNAAALRIALDGQAELVFASPRQAAKIFADLQVIVGVAHHNEGRVDLARIAFAHVHRLDPGRSLDPRRFVPEALRAFSAAATQGGPDGTLDVKGNGTVWIDGTEVGTAPGAFPVADGLHVVWLVGLDRETRGVTTAVAAGATVPVEIPDAPASRRVRVQRARHLLASAPDYTVRATTMHKLAAMLGVQDAVLVDSANGHLIVQTWRSGSPDRAPGFSAHRERGTLSAAVLLEPLGGARSEPIEDPPPEIVTEDPRWWKNWKYWAGIGVVAGVVTGVTLWLTADPRTIEFDRDFTVESRR